MLGHTPQCSGVSTQVLAECTPALAGEGRKNQSLLVPNVLERAEERAETIYAEGVSESRTGRGPLSFGVTTNSAGVQLLLVLFEQYRL